MIHYVVLYYIILYYTVICSGEVLAGDAAILAERAALRAPNDNNYYVI